MNVIVKIAECADGSELFVFNLEAEVFFNQYNEIYQIKTVYFKCFYNIGIGPQFIAFNFKIFYYKIIDFLYNLLSGHALSPCLCGNFFYYQNRIGTAESERIGKNGIDFSIKGFGHYGKFGCEFVGIFKIDIGRNK